MPQGNPEEGTVVINVVTVSGIQFDTDPQLGDWLFVQTNNPSHAPAHTYSMELLDTAPNPPGLGGIHLQSDHHAVDLVSGGASVFVSDNGGTAIRADASLGAGTAGQVSLTAVANAASNVQVYAVGPGLPTPYAPFTSWDVGSGVWGTSGIHCRVPTGGGFEIWSVSPNRVIFRVTESGTFHILSGASWAADL